jgi:selenide, water dikinase
MRQLQPSSNPAVLVGTETADDAAVYQIDPDTAIVSTVDFITPVVDDPYVFGQVAAANSLSDIWAMGARPLFALNLAAFPPDLVPPDIIAEVLRGGADKAAEAGVPIIGGHTVKDDEPKYGLAVNGLVHPQRIIRNSRAMPGDALVLTKPLGVGVIATAIKRDLASPSVVQRAVEVMCALNRGAGEAIVSTGVSAATDVSGFGLLGHLREIVVASGVEAEISFSAVPFIGGAEELAETGCVPGGTQDNYAFVTAEGTVVWEANLTEGQRLLLADAQTSGGLLIAVPDDRLAALLEALDDAKSPLRAVIGRVPGKGAAGTIRVLP